MYYHVLPCFFVIMYATITAQTINVRGSVSNQTGGAIPNAIVTLMNQELKDTTDSDGKYSITRNSVAVSPSPFQQKERVLLNKGILEVNVNDCTPVAVEIFDIKGNLLKKVSSPGETKNSFRLDLKKHFSASNLLVIHALIGQREMTFRYNPLQNGKCVINTPHGKETHRGNNVAKTTSALDSLEIKADGYTKKVVTIASFDTVVDITLDTIIENVVCEGCGKTDYPRSGRATINVNGTLREYTLKLPDRYDPHQPYKLIFCFHWWGGSMDDVVGGTITGGPYYGLESLSNGTAIFVAPNGLEDNNQPRGWANPNGRDIKFVRALLDYLNSNLCIDQQRIFSTGFSYGGMMSYAIGCAMGSVFRAIAPMSGAFYSGCDRTTEDPIAVWMAHGKSDDVVPLNDGKTALQYFIQKNGCSNETTPVEPSPCVAYRGCREGFPVIYCEFNGGHGPQRFAPQATWEFFSQF